MKILFISDDFFGYAKEIKLALERRGHEVVWFPDRHATDAMSKFLIRVAPKLVASSAHRHLDKILSACEGQVIDQVFVIKAEGLSLAMIRKLREALPQARFTLYFWDSYDNMPADSAQKVALFDTTFSFDPIDVAADARLQYRSLFYLDEYAGIAGSQEDIDVLFFGTIHTDRYAVLSKLTAALPSGLKVHRVMYFASQWIYRVRSIFDPTFWQAKRSDFIFKPLKKAEVMSLISRARVVIDIERAVQSGLTMRTFEMLGASKKLITTNTQVRSTEFYRPENICVIDRAKPVVDTAFLRDGYVQAPRELLNKYSLSGWLDEVLPGS